MLPFMLSTPRVTCFANDNSALIPELWAPEALRTLMSNTVMASLVNRDFQNQLASFGDVVNTSRPRDFSGKRKTDADNITIQDAVSPNIPVKLDQHVHVAFEIKDQEMSLALPDLVQRYLEPAAREMAEKVDQVVAGQTARLAVHTAGRLGEMDKTNASDFILETTTVLDENRAPRAGRNLVLGPRAQQAALAADLVVRADQRGDGGTALESAMIGRVYGIDTFMDQNMSYTRAERADSVAGATTAAYPAGTVTVATTVPFADVVVGDYVVIEGDGEAYRVSAVVDNGGNADVDVAVDDKANPGSQSAAPSAGLLHDVANGAGVTLYKSGTTGAAYAAGYAKEVRVQGHTANKGPQMGQWVSFGTGATAKTYTVIAVTAVSATETDVLLDRPLEIAVGNGDGAHVGPAGGVNLAFHREAVALVVRPLHVPPADTGVRSAVASFDGLSMRVSMQYDIERQAMVVNFDLLCGVSVLDDRLAVVMYS